MEYPNISLYRVISDVNSQEVIPMDMFFDAIRNGDWQDIVLPIRATKDKEAREALKKRLPNVTMSGVFSTRNDKGLITHSGLIGVDVDDLGTSVEAFKQMLRQDKYAHAVYTSVSGYGVRIIVRIDPDHHRDAYLGLADYFLKKYKQPVDPTSINLSRANFVSYDPDLYVNEKSEVFRKYLPKEKKRSLPPVVFVQTEFDDVIRQIIDRRVNCCDSYRDWLKVCFALCNRFGEAGRDYFHSLSAISAKYEPAACDKQYTLALSHEELWSGNKATLATIYYHAKLAGIDIASERTRKITAATSSMKKSGLSREIIIDNLQKYEGIDPSDSQAIVGQAFDSGHNFHESKDSETLIDSVILWLKTNYELRRNCITLRVEDRGRPLQDEDLNTMFLLAKRVFKDVTFDFMCRCIYSHFTPTYNPFTEWWAEHEDKPYNDEIMRYFRCITLADEDQFNKMVYFGTKWLVSIIAALHYKAPPLMLTWTGPVGVGKTRLFRDLMPYGWRNPVDYYAESSNLGANKDENSLMCQKILIVDNEFGGMGKREQRKFKAMTDEDVFSMRPPYGRTIVDMRRICGLGATCNEDEVLQDTHDNRRILPFKVVSVDWEAVNMIDRDALWAEVWRMYSTGYDWTVVGNDIKVLAEGVEIFLDLSQEYELINSYFILPTGDTLGVRELSASEIKVMIERLSGQRINLGKLGQELKRIGFQQVSKKVNGKTCRVYKVIERKTDPGSLDLGKWEGFGESNPF